MEQDSLHQMLLRYNRVFKDTDQVYHQMARICGLPDCAFWILYLLRESEVKYTQSGVSENLSLSRQTVNSALKKLQQEGYIAMAPGESNRKNKPLRLTHRGEELCRNTVDLVLQAEINTLARFTPEERESFLSLQEQYAQALRQEGNRLLLPCSGEEEQG